MSHSLNGSSVGALTCVSLSCLLSDGVEPSVSTALRDRDLGSGTLVEKNILDSSLVTLIDSCLVLSTTPVY